MTAHTLERTAFKTSRLLEFFSEKELQMQIGHPRPAWPIALLKELIDNALDACESAGIPPSIHVTIDAQSITVEDNGPGLPLATLRRSLDYLYRVSDKAHYVSPTRGQLGNALKCVWAAPYVWTGERGRVDVTTGGRVYQIDVTLDRIAQMPRPEMTEHPAIVKSGTIIKVYWPGVAGYLGYPEPGDFYNVSPSAYEVLRHYAAFNPHGAFRLDFGRDVSNYTPTAEKSAKWLPTEPTSPHWYTPDRLRALIAAYLSDERDDGKARTVREFVSEFRGLSGTAKQKAVTEAAGLSGAWLRDLVEGDDVSAARAGWLLAAMQAQSRIVKPAALGVLGEVHLAQHLVNHEYVEAESVQYKKVDGLADGLPFVLEVGFGIYRPNCHGAGRSLTIGLNWTPALRSPISQLTALLGENRVDAHDPVAVIVHLACPRLDFTDRGKSVLALPTEIRKALQKAIQTTCKRWKAIKRQADQDDRVRQRDLDELRRANRARELSIKEAAYEVMADAYMEASTNNTLPANARQIMYAARPRILKLTGGKTWKNSSYFTQHLLPDYLEDYPEVTQDWDVVFDDRGHFAEPHTGTRLGLGTLAVRRYMEGWESDIDACLPTVELPHAVGTSGPANRYRFALFVEKEGFNELFEHIELSDSFDLAIMSTKGMSVTAARRLVETLSAQGVAILVLHDFDKAGLSIFHTLHSDTRRFRFKTTPRVIDVGLRQADVEALGLESERVEYDGQVDPRVNLLESGATMAEANFLVRARDRSTGRWIGERVELNAMSSGQLVTWLKDKLAALGVVKVVPDEVTLKQAYQRALHIAKIQKLIVALVVDQDGDVPDDLAAMIRDKIDGKAAAWDDAVWELAREAATLEY